MIDREQMIQAIIAAGDAILLNTSDEYWEGRTDQDGVQPYRAWLEANRIDEGAFTEAIETVASSAAVAQPPIGHVLAHAFIIGYTLATLYGATDIDIPDAPPAPST